MICTISFVLFFQAPHTFFNSENTFILVFHFKSQLEKKQSNSYCTQMGSNISTAIINLEQAASTEEMVKAAKQIADFGVTDHTPEQLNRLIRALSEAARRAIDAASVVAWARAFDLTCSHQKQADALATSTIVATFAQLAQHATTSESVQDLTRAIGNIAALATQATKDTFATTAIVDAFVLLTPHATTPQSIECLATAIGNITGGKTQATKDAFATPEIAAAFVQLASHATTPESVEDLTCAIGNITRGSRLATGRAFANPAIVDAFVQLAPHATTPKAVGFLTRAIGNITLGTGPDKSRVRNPCDGNCLRAAGSTRNHTTSRSTSDNSDRQHHCRAAGSPKGCVLNPCDCRRLRAAGSTRNNTRVR